MKLEEIQTLKLRLFAWKIMCVLLFLVLLAVLFITGVYIVSGKIGEFEPRGYGRDATCIAPKGKC